MVLEIKGLRNHIKHWRMLHPLARDPEMSFIITSACHTVVGNPNETAPSVQLRKPIYFSLSSF